MIRVQRHELDRSGALPEEHLGHDLAFTGPDDDAIVAPHLRPRLDDQNVAVAVERHHAVALHLERIDAGFLCRRRWELDDVPALADRETAIVEKAAGARLRKPQQRN